MSEYVDTIELLRWERRMADLTTAALRKYLQRAQEAVLPSLTAAGLGPIPPDPGALTATYSDWERLLVEEVMPGVEALMAERVLRLAREAGISIPEAAGALGVYGAATGATRLAYAIPTVREWMETYLAAVENRMVQTPDSVFRLVASALDEGIDNGDAIDVLRDRVQEVLDFTGNSDWPRRAELVARTEATGAYNAAGFEAARLEEQTLGITLEKAWVCTIDGVTRDTHFAADGQRVPLDGTFQVGRAELRFPGDPDGMIEETANCVTGDALVAWPGQDVLKAFRRSHEGTFVNLRTARGHVLTVTPNHPVLTPAGYVAAGDLAVGDRVLATPEPVAPDVQDGPPRIEEAFRTLGEGGVQERIVGDGVVFHGDVSDKRVDVVTADGSLRDRVESGGSEGVHEGRLAGLGRPEGAGLGLGGRQGGLEPVLSGGGQRVGASSGRVGGGGEFASLGGGEAFHAESVGLGAAADGQAEFGEPSGDEGARDAEALRHLKDAHAVGMEPTQLVEVEMYAGRHDVFNLSTSGEWYTANGISVHNCRCTMIRLEPEDPLPSEGDRQTERGPTDSVVKNRDGRSRQDEIDKRAADGVTRARDEDALRASAIGDDMKRKWTGRLVPIGEASGDRRIFKAGGDFTFRTFPLPLMHQKQTSGGHDESVTVGSIRAAEVREDGIYAEGVLFDTPEAQEAAAMLEEGVTRPSIDWCDESWELVDSSGNPVDPEALTAETIDDVVYQITGMTLMAATLVSKPAFDGTHVTLIEGDEAVDTEEEETALAASLVASGHPGAPVFDAAAFANPNLDKVTGIHATPDGRVVGHVATWNECHVGVRDRCVMAPRSKTGYALFHVSEVETTEGPVAVGRLTVGAGHADPRAGVIPAQEHYDNAASCWALGRVYEDDHGIAFAGVVHPEATPRQIMDGTSAPLSGDWRRHAGNLELVAALTVNTPGYPVVRGAADKNGRDFSLVAAGVVPLDTHEKEQPLSEIVASAAKAAVAEYAEHLRRAEKVAAVDARVRERLDAETADRVAALAARREEVLS